MGDKKLMWKVGNGSFKVHFAVDASGSQPRIVFPDPKEEDFQKNPNLKKCWAEFKKWSWRESNDILKLAQTKDAITGATSMDYYLLREWKVRKLLLDWSLKDEDPSLKIDRVVLNDKTNEGELTENCWKEVSDISPLVLTTLINKADLVLELNQEEVENFTKAVEQPSVQLAETA